MAKKATRATRDVESIDGGGGNLGYWSITTFVNNDFVCVAGKKHSDLQDPKMYKTKPTAPFSLLFDIFDKMEKANKENKDYITVTLEPDPAGGQFIVPDPKLSESPPAYATAKKAAPRRRASRSKRSARSKDGKGKGVGKGKDGKGKDGKGKDGK